jgi:hypothetical protein
VEPEMNMFDAAEKLLRGELTVEEFHKVRTSDLGAAVMELARHRGAAFRLREHEWYKTTDGNLYLEAFVSRSGVHWGPECWRCGYKRCVVCQEVAEGYDEDHKCKAVKLDR